MTTEKNPAEATGHRIGRLLSPLCCTSCRLAIGVTERFERVDNRNYHVGCVPAGTAAGGV